MTVRDLQEALGLYSDSNIGVPVLSVVKRLVRTLNDYDRVEVFSGFGQFCHHCGGDELPCHCANEE